MCEGIRALLPCPTLCGFFDFIDPHVTQRSQSQQRAPSVLSELKAQIEAASRTTLLSSPLGKAAAQAQAAQLSIVFRASFAGSELCETLDGIGANTAIQQQ